jgi:hypothetical protein
MFVSPIRNKSRVYHTITAFSLIILALAVVGCMSSRSIQVIPTGSRGTLDLSADDIVEIMSAAGFSDTQIVEYGKQVHDGLAKSGAVQIKVGRKVEAIFAVNGNDIYISTRLRGYFIYNINTGWVTGDRG